MSVISLPEYQQSTTGASVQEPQNGADMTPVDFWLTKQKELTAVELFSRVHSEDALPAQAKYYSALLPATSPGPGQQYGFEVDLDRCSGCKACVTACHSLNGLDESETWRDVGLLIGGTTELPVMQHVTTACHHCLEPGCLSACPVNAYEKDSVTGIVKHLDDQCIGCQYCTLACPYDVPKYHEKKGIVRKCDLCSDRLADGEAPACVQACPDHAIAVRLVDVEQVIENSETDQFLPGAPAPTITLPTTSYKTSRVFPRNLLPADYHSVKKEHAHWPLVIMLVMTQLSVGAVLLSRVLEGWLNTAEVVMLRPAFSLGALLFGLTALGASTFHLGRPQYAFRAFLGWRHSWMSREIIVFGAFAGAAVTDAGFNQFADLSDPGNFMISSILGWMVAGTGLLGIICSAMIYVITRKECWSGVRVFSRFLLTMLLLGPAMLWLVFLAAPVVGLSLPESVVPVLGPMLCQVILVVSVIKLSMEFARFRFLNARQNSILKQSAKLMAGELVSISIGRFAFGVIGGLIMPLLLLSGDFTMTPLEMPLIASLQVGLLFAACFAGELLERYLFFAACVSPRMPGGL